jgi:hypothetical protein
MPHTLFKCIKKEKVLHLSLGNPAFWPSLLLVLMFSSFHTQMSPQNQLGENLCGEDRDRQAIESAFWNPSACGHFDLLSHAIRTLLVLMFIL